MEYPWYDFLQRFNAKHGGTVWHNDKANTRTAILVDGRSQWQLPIVVKNFRHFLGEGWNLSIFHLRQNAGFIEREFGEWDVDRYIVDKPRISPEAFSDLLTTPAFWDTFMEMDRVLVFQADCIACKPLDEKWLLYDFIGAPCGENVEIFNGGLSIRNPKRMKEALERYGWAIPTTIEDVFYSKALKLMHANLPIGYDAGCFSVENVYYELPFGVHGTDKGYLSNVLAEKIASEVRL